MGHLKRVLRGGPGRGRIVAVILAVLAGGCSTRSVPPQEFPDGSGTLVVEMSGFRFDHGRAIASLFAGAEGFPDAMGEGIRSLDAPVSGGHARITFPDVPWGEYAVSVLHDEDGDGRMNSNWLGMAKEGHGISNNPESRFGPPDFDEARFAFVGIERIVTVKIRYPEEHGPGFQKR